MIENTYRTLEDHMLRTIRRWFSDAEVKALGNEMDAMIERHQDYGHKLEGLSLRMERFMNRTQMRLSRAGVPGAGELDDADRKILDDLRHGRAQLAVTEDDFGTNPYER